MKRRTTSLLIVFTSAVIPLNSLSAQDALQAKAKIFFKPVSAVEPTLKDNAPSPEKEKLGKMLFFDPRLSKSGLISCNTCHNLGMGGDDNLPTSVGHRWQKGPRNAPTVLNAVYNIAQFWDGRAEDLKEQAKGPVQAGVEMANLPANVVTALKSMPEYVTHFKAAFPGEEDPVSFDNMAKAIEVFEATLTTPGAPFDKFLEGDPKALDDDERQGLDLFINKGCTACHMGVNLGGQAYFPFGLVKRPGADVMPIEDKGRFAVTKTASDSYVFRAAPLRNVAITAPYFHSGLVWSLEEAVSIMGTAQLGAELNEEEVRKITAFLKSLTGEQPKVEYPILPPETEKTPKPEL